MHCCTVLWTLTHRLFEDMFAEDSEQSKLRQLPGISELQEDYQDKVNGELEEFKTEALEKHAGRLKEQSDFEGAVKTLTRKSDAMNEELVTDFDRKLKHLDRAFEKEPDALLEREEKEQFLTNMLVQNEQLGVNMRRVEVNHVDSFDKLINIFDVRRQPCNRI